MSIQLRWDPVITPWSHMILLRHLQEYRCLTASYSVDCLVTTSIINTARSHIVKYRYLTASYYVDCLVTTSIINTAMIPMPNNKYMFTALSQPLSSSTPTRMARLKVGDGGGHHEIAQWTNALTPIQNNITRSRLPRFKPSPSLTFSQYLVPAWQWNVWKPHLCGVATYWPCMGYSRCDQLVRHW